MTTQLLDVLSSVPSTPERTTQELTLRTSQARAVMALHGYTQEVEEAYDRALAPFTDGRQLPQLFPVLRGLASFYTYRAEFAKGAEIGREILALAEAQDDASMRVDGHLVLGSSLAMQTDLRAGLEQLDKAIEWFEAEGSRSRRFRLGNNPGVAAFMTSALVLWLLGFPDRAIGRAHRALTLATRLEHPVTAAYALFHTAFLYLWRREPELCRDRAVALLDVADENDLPIWRAIGTFLVGAAEAWIGRIDEGLADMRDGLNHYRGLKTPPVFWPLILLVQAGVCLKSGRPSQGISLIDEALEVAGKGSGLTLLPAFYILKGELRLALPSASPAEAELWFERAFNRAGELGAKMPQLQAAIALCRSRSDPAGREAATQRLRQVYSTFTEGFTIPDLMEANVLLAAEAVAP